MPRPWNLPLAPITKRFARARIDLDVPGLVAIGGAELEARDALVHANLLDRGRHVGVLALDGQVVELGRAGVRGVAGIPVLARLTVK